MGEMPKGEIRGYSMFLIPPVKQKTKSRYIWTEARDGQQPAVGTKFNADVFDEIFSFLWTGLYCQKQVHPYPSYQEQNGGIPGVGRECFGQGHYDGQKDQAGDKTGG